MYVHLKGSTMNFSQLECFVSLAGTLNFMQTAEQLSISQPAVSKQLKALEEEFRTTLFKRTSREVVITPAGEDFLKHAKEILKAYYTTLEQLKRYEHNPENKIRIGYADPNILPLLGKLLHTFSDTEDLGKLSFELVQGETDENLSRLKKSQVDVIVGMKDARFEDSEIIFRKLNENYFYCVLPLAHPLSDRFVKGEWQSISTQTLWPFRQILAIPPYLLKNFYSRGTRILPVNDSLDNLICASTAEAYAFVEAGLGYAMIPSFLLRDSKNTIAVKWEESPHAPFGLYYRMLKNKKSHLFVFLESIKAYYNKDV